MKPQGETWDLVSRRESRIENSPSSYLYFETNQKKKRRTLQYMVYLPVKQPCLAIPTLFRLPKKPPGCLSSSLPSMSLTQKSLTHKRTRATLGPVLPQQLPGPKGILTPPPGCLGFKQSTFRLSMRFHKNVVA